MMRTISAMVGKGSVSHNSRQFNAKNTDPERTPLNINYCKGIIAGLRNKIAELEQKLSSRDSIREQMERGKLKSENDSLRKENQKLRDVLAAHGIPFGRKQVDRDSR